MADVIEDIKNTIDVISFFEIRNEKLKEELDFFKDLDNPLMHLGALIRLNHEVMYLCVDAYSLHQGISQKKSLYSKSIKNNAAKLSKVDKTEIPIENTVNLGKATSSGMQNTTSQEGMRIKRQIDKIALHARRELRDTRGIKSSSNIDSDQWLENIQKKSVVDQLQNYRTEFAHRLDSLENLGKELELPSYEDLDKRLKVISEILENYKSALKDILTYTTSNSDDGFVGIEYDSISRIKQWVELEPRLYSEG